MKREFFKYLLIFVGVVMLSACGSGSGGSSDSDSSSESNTMSITLTWSTPTQNEDNTPLDSNDILAYQVYYGTDQNDLNNSFLIEDGNANSYILEYETHSIQRNTTYYIAMSTIVTSGVQSDLSQVISFNSK